MRRIFRVLLAALFGASVAAFIIAAVIGWHQNTRLTIELAELKLAQPVLAACPIPPLDSPQSLIIWRTRDGIGGEEIRCVHGRIKPADPRAVGPARPGSAS